MIVCEGADYWICDLPLLRENLTISTREALRKRPNYVTLLKNQNDFLEDANDSNYRL